MMRAGYCQRIYRNGLNGNRTCGASNPFNPILESVDSSPRPLALTCLEQFSDAHTMLLCFLEWEKP